MLSHRWSLKVRGFRNKPVPDKLNSLATLMCRIKAIIYYGRIFGSFGKGSILRKPMLLSNTRYMHIGRNVSIRQGARLEVIFTDPHRTPQLLIEDGAAIEQRVQIVCHCRVAIRQNAGLGPNCIIMDTSHPFFDIGSSCPIKNRLSTAESFVEIGEGSLIGAGTFIMPNVRIGKHAVIGANSVVRKSIPDYCVAGGNPARVLFRYDTSQNRWTSVADN